MKIQPRPILCLALLVLACGGTKTTPTVTPAPSASAPPALAEYKSAFDKGSTEKWTPLLGNWWVKDGVYQQDDDRMQGAKTMLSLPESDCYTLQFKARKPRFTSGGFMAVVRFQKHYVWWEIGGRNNTSSGVVGIENPDETSRSFYFDEKVWYKVKVIVNGERLIGWLNDAQKWSIRRSPAQVKGLDPNDPAIGKDLVGLAGLGTWGTHVEFADIEVQPTCK